MLFRTKAGAKNAAEIFIYEDIGEGWFGGMSAKAFSDELKKLGNVDIIDVRINSYGGDVFDGLAIYSQLQTHKAKITTYIDGIAASIASVIAMAGEQIHIAQAGFVMIHDPWGVARGNAKELRQFAEQLDAISGSIADVYVARTARSQGEIREWMAAETWFNSADAVKNGFATKVVENLQAAASATKSDPARYKFKHAPSVVSTTRAILAPRPTDHARARFEEQSARGAQRAIKRAS